MVIGGKKNTSTEIIRKFNPNGSIKRITMTLFLYIKNVLKIMQLP